MNTENLNKALNYTLLLHFSKYSQKRLAGIEFLSELIEMEDKTLFHSKLKQIFSLSDKDISENCKSFLKCLHNFKNDYQIVYIKDHAYPRLLRKTESPPLFLFCRGDLSLFNDKGIAVVGSRNASELGLKRAQKLAMLLVAKGYVVVSGLAKGIDAAAHKGAIGAGGKTIAVIGTPLDKSYPKENAELQEYIAQKHLLVTQFPFGHPVNRASFPTRNYTMSGVSYATVIVEAGETSGALIQARQCMTQEHHLFLLKNLLDRQDLAWPKKYVAKGAYVISDIEDIPSALQKTPQYQLDNVEKVEKKINPPAKQQNLFT